MRKKRKILEIGIFGHMKKYRKKKDTLLMAGWVTLMDDALSNCPCHCRLLTHTPTIINCFPTFPPEIMWRKY